MKLHFLSAVGSAVLLTSGVALASAPVIGIASSQSGVTLDNAKVSGNATIFDGSTVQTDGYSRIHLNNGTRLDLGAGSKATVYSNRMSLERGSSETQGTNFEVSANTLKIRSEAGGTARVKIDGNKMVYVTALNASVNVLNREGLLVAKVAPGLPLSFMPQAAGASVFENTGCIVVKSGSALLVDETGNQTFDLRGMDLRKVVGSQVKVSGTIDSSAKSAAGASQVIKVSKAVVVRKGGCSAVASKVGASTAAAGLAAGVAGAGAGAGAAAGAAGAAGAAAAGAGAAAGAAAAGISTTALVVGGVAAATAASVGVAQATGAFDDASN